MYPTFWAAFWHQYGVQQLLLDTSLVPESGPDSDPKNFTTIYQYMVPHVHTGIFVRTEKHMPPVASWWHVSVIHMHASTLL